MSNPISNTRKWLAVLPAMIIPSLGSLLYFVYAETSETVQIVYALVKLFTLIWPLIAYSWIFKLGAPVFNKEQSLHVRALPVGLLTGSIIVASIVLAYLSPLGGAAQTSAEHIREKVTQTGVIHHYLEFGIFLAFVHSGIEEYYWRWFVWGTLTGLLTRWTAHSLAAIAFASHHVVVLSQYFPLSYALLFGAGVAAGGFIWSWQYERDRTLAGCWVSHIMADIAMLSVGYHLIFS